MSTISDVLDGIRQAIVMDERVRALSVQVNRMDEHLTDTRERVIVLETMLKLLSTNSGGSRSTLVLPPRQGEPE